MRERAAGREFRRVGTSRNLRCTGRASCDFRGFGYIGPESRRSVGFCRSVNKRHGRGTDCQDYSDPDKVRRQPLHARREERADVLLRE